MGKTISILSVLLLFLACKNAPDYVKEKKQNSTLSNVEPASKFFHSLPQAIVSAHRGGSGIPNYPENCLETMDFLYKKGIQVFEIDVFQTSDNKLFLLHDDFLDRTTTGTGKTTLKTAGDLKDLYLVDDFNNTTKFRIPSFEKVLQWGRKNSVYFMIDFKKNVSFKETIDLIRQNEMEDQVVLICYNMGQARKLYNLAPDMLLSVSARNMEELGWLLDSQIPTDNVVAFTGTKLSAPVLYKELGNLQIPAILGTLGNLDRKAQAKGDKLYKEWEKQGIKIFATDRALEAYKALNE